jgi:TonB family protein
MSHHPTWRPDSAEPIQSDLASPGKAEETQSASRPAGESDPVAAKAESDFSELAAKFAAHGSGKIPADLSGDLALDVVLNEIVEQACLATRAAGAAIALTRGDEMVCRASSGGIAPELGTRLEMHAGLSGACVRTRSMQCCNDALVDPRVDADVSRQLGVRSVVVVPLVSDEKLIGIFEIFSPRPAAFGERDLQTLEVLAECILKNTRARHSSRFSSGLAPTSFESSPAPQEDAEDLLKRLQASGRSASEVPAHSPLVEAETDAAPQETRIDWLTAVMGAMVISGAMLMGLALGVHAGWLRGNHASKAATMGPSADRVEPSAKATKENSTAGTASPFAAENSPAAGQSEGGSEGVRIPEGSLRVYENGKEIFRTSPASSEAGKEANTGTASHGASIVELSPDAAEGSLTRRVEPQYPEQALAQRLQGAVQLEVRIGREGAVQEIKLVSGDPLLAAAAIAAVRQWQFAPHTVSGRAVEMETRITLRFTLPPN